MAKGRGQEIEFAVTATRSGCSKCRGEAKVYVKADVYELSVARPDYLGLDLTDAMKGKLVTREAVAKVDPSVDGVEYGWMECGKCEFVGAVDAADVAYGATGATGPSDSYLAERLAVRATVRDSEGIGASAVCVTNFTIVKVDVQIAGVGEDEEEAKGAFVSAVADAEDGRITEEGTNKMVAVAFSCAPTDLPTNEVVTITSSGSGELYERLADGELVLVTTTNYPACELAGHRFRLHGHSASGGYKDGEIRIIHKTSGATDLAKYTVLKVDLRATDLFGQVDDDTEGMQGAYVHWNIDNDDSSDNAVGAPKHPGGDYLQAEPGPVTQEDDLKPLLMSISPCPSTGSVVLRVGGNNAKIWKSKEKGGTNLVVAGVGEERWDLAESDQRQEFNALCSGLWVEGVAKGESQVMLSYIGNCSDTVKYTFIAANCGRQLRTDNGERGLMESYFPGLVRCEWSITGGASRYYNCLAWAVGKTDVWVNDVLEVNGASLSELVLNGVTYWGIDMKYGNGDGVRDIADIDSFFLAEANVVPTASVEDATIIYYDGYHAAKRMNCDCGSGCWDVFESKCGAGYRIEHVYDQITGLYGDSVRYYRPR